MARRLRRRRATEDRPDADGVLVLPARHNAARHVLEALADGGNGTALKFVDELGVIDRWTSRDIVSQSSRWTALLRSRDLVPGDRVLVRLGETPARPTVLLGALAGGFVVVPCSATLDAPDVEALVALSEARVAIVDGANASFAEGLRDGLGIVVVEDADEELRGHPIDEPIHESAATDPAAILYGEDVSRPPRLITHADDSGGAGCLQPDASLEFRPDDVVWCTTGTRWADSAAEVLRGPWLRGGQLVIRRGSFDPEEHLQLVERLGVTVLAQTPEEYRLMADHPSFVEHDLRGVRDAVSFGEPDVDVIDAFRETFGITLRDGRLGLEVVTVRVATEAAMEGTATDETVEGSAAGDIVASAAQAVAAVDEPPPSEQRVDEVLLQEVRHREVVRQDIEDEDDTPNDGRVVVAEPAFGETEPVEGEDTTNEMLLSRLSAYGHDVRTGS